MYDWPSFEELAELENYSRAWYQVEQYSSINWWRWYMVIDTERYTADESDDPIILKTREPEF